MTLASGYHQRLWTISIVMYRYKYYVEFYGDYVSIVNIGILVPSFVYHLAPAAHLCIRRVLDSLPYRYMYRYVRTYYRYR